MLSHAISISTVTSLALRSCPTMVPHVEMAVICPRWDESPRCC
jgi:hypothetical protein